MTQRSRLNYCSLTSLVLLAACPDGNGDTGAGTTTSATNPTTGATTTPTTGGPGGEPTSTSATSEPTTASGGTDATSATGETAGTMTDPTGTTAVTGLTGTDTGDSALMIAPDNVVIELVDGTIVTQDFTATLDGKDVTAEVVWAYDQDAIGAMNTATFVPTGMLAGPGTLTATHPQAVDDTQVTVKIKKTIDPDGLAPGFGDPVGPDPALSILYPYDNTVFPLKVASPVVQWGGVPDGSQYKLHLQEQFYEYTVYFTANNPARHLIDEVEWIAISDSGQGAKSDPLSFELQRKTGDMTFAAVKQTWKIAQARLPGRIYYWELPSQCGNSNGRVLSIKPTEAKAEEFFPTGQCYGCHSVSRDGRTVSVAYDNGSPFPLGTIDVSTEPAVQGPIAPGSGLGGTFSAFNHDGTKLLFSNDAANAGTSSLVIADTMTAQVLNPNVMGTGCGEPAWSPDGKSLAFIRRVGGTGGGADRTTLFVRDLESGAERPVYGGLDRDMQETWAIHGVYPALAWTPDDRELVFWAAGKLWRTLADGRQPTPTEIPFHVKTTRKVAPAVRFPVPVAPREFDVKALRDVAVSPDGKSVVYQALGHLYLRTLPEGQPRRLTKIDDRFEQDPAFSRDGKSVVFTTWDDQALGSVRLTPIKGGKERVLTERPGHYVEPTFSPDGKTVVYRRIGGGWTRTPTWSQEQGIYFVSSSPRKGEAPTLITRDGEQPHFGAEPDRIYYTAYGEEDKIQLESVTLGGSGRLVKRDWPRAGLRLN